MYTLRTFSRAAIVSSVAFVAGAALAAGSQDMDVKATVQGVCKLIAVPPMSFTIDPSLAASATNGTAKSTVQYQCTKGTKPVEFKVGGAASAYSGSLSSTTASASMAFDIAWTAPTAAGVGFNATTPIDVVLTGTIAEAIFQNAPAATDYSAKVTVLINN